MLKFAALFLASHFCVMQLFRLTTYHAYFWKALPLLVAFGVLVGWALYYFDLHQFFLWQVVLASAWLFYVARSQTNAAKALLAAAGTDAVRFAATSASKTASLYTYSAFVYVIALSVSYLWFYNA